MRIHDPILFSYFRACGGQARSYTRWLQQLGVLPPIINRRYSPAALLPATVEAMRKLEAKPTAISASGVATAEDAVNRAARALSIRTLTPIMRRKYEARLFYATAKRDAIRMLLSDYNPKDLLASSVSRIRREPGVGIKLARARYQLRVSMKVEATAAFEAEQASTLATAAQDEYIAAKARASLRKDEIDHELTVRRVEAERNVRHSPGNKQERDALDRTVRETRKIAQRLTPVAQAKRKRLAAVRDRIEHLRATIAALEKRKLFNPLGVK